MIEYRYDCPFKFTGKIDKLRFDLGPAFAANGSGLSCGRQLCCTRCWRYFSPGLGSIDNITKFENNQPLEKLAG
jgi:hypothetical protein